MREKMTVVSVIQSATGLWMVVIADRPKSALCTGFKCAQDAVKWATNQGHKVFNE